MVIRPVILDRKPSAGHVLAFSKSGISLSAKFIKENDLVSKEGIKFFRDDEDDYWLGFQLLDDFNDSDSLALVSTPKSNSRYCKATEIINKTPVLAEIQKMAFKADRAFEINWDKTSKLWFVRLRPVFERSVLWEDRKMIPDDVIGIYRYFSKAGELLYIGKGWIKKRLATSERQDWGIETIQYSILNNDHECLRWESFYLEEHKNRYGVLPTFNRVAGHSQDD